MRFAPATAFFARETTNCQRGTMTCVAMILCLLAFSCTRGETQPTAPVAALGQSVAAQQAFKLLDQAWHEGSDRERQDLESRLVKFIDSFPNDPEVHQVRVWLGWLRLTKGQLQDAQALAEQGSSEKVGNTFETAQVLKAAILTTRGQPEQSLRLLEPLSGQIVDSRERDTWAREIIRAALRLKHDDDALKWALAWRLDSSEDRRASIDREIGLVLDQVSRPALDRLWSQLVMAERIPTTSPSRKQGRVWMREAVLQRLAHFAIEKHDSSLARRLLNDAWLPLQKNSSLKRLARVAAQGETELQGLTRTVGVVLELDDAQQRRRSNEMLTGVLQTLDDIVGQTTVQLRTREALRSDQEGYADAVESLYNDGVALLVGGFEPASARLLAKSARAKMLPVITLSTLDRSDQFEASFWIDASDRAIIEEWHYASPGDVETTRIVTDEDSACSTENDSPFEQWRKSPIARVLLACGVACAEKLGQAAFDAQKLPSIWFGPKAIAGESSWRNDQIKGEMTFARLVDAQARDDGLDRWRKRFSRWPGYFEVLGHDIALLSAAGFEGFPSQVLNNPEGRKQALHNVVLHLENARVALWSCKSQGFGTNHSMVPNYAIQPSHSQQLRAPAGTDARRP